jgi:2-dehydro-3-deoxygluconokinase
MRRSTACARPAVDVSRIVRARADGLYFLTPAAGQRRLGDLRPRGQRVRRDARLRLAALLEGAGWLHLRASSRARAGDGRSRPRAIAAARAAGVRVSFDGNFPRLAVGALVPRSRADPADYIAGATCCSATIATCRWRSAREFAGDDARQHDAALAAFERFPQLARSPRPGARSSPPTTTACPRGSTARDAVRRPALDVPGIVDRIGTGDAFAAGVLARSTTGSSSGAAPASRSPRSSTASPATTARPRRATSRLSPRPSDVRR